LKTIEKKTLQKKVLHSEQIRKIRHFDISIVPGFVSGNGRDNLLREAERQLPKSCFETISAAAGILDSFPKKPSNS